MFIKAKEKGFTLIEVIIALAIFSLISIAAYKSIDGLIKIKERIEQEDRKWRQVMVFLDRFEMDIKQHVNRPIRNANDIIEPAWWAQPLITNQHDSQLTFSRFGNAQLSGYLMDTRRIGYRLNRGSIELVQWPSLDLTKGVNPEVFEVLQNVNNLNIKYLTNDGRWILYWPEVAGNNSADTIFPKAVSLNITMHSGEKIQRLFSL